MNDFDSEVSNIGRQRAVAFFLPRLIVIALVIGLSLAYAI